jgi:hypothetical protein
VVVVVAVVVDVVISSWHSALSTLAVVGDDSDHR